MEIHRIKNLLLNLPEKQQILLEMIYFQGYTHIETAERMGMPMESVKTSVRNAMILLRGSFKERYYHNQSA
ncbi:sigma factor-like helix-turn-helix DNA-binding protein [Pedobacter psychrodurus]|uniref:sigma factor-like helix-turn-helix DNA-binding protein n=1 Tax=Pedobacter psychrodurus TaxID=2530456 RepID=UPI003977892B